MSGLKEKEKESESSSSEPLPGKFLKRTKSRKFGPSTAMATPIQNHDLPKEISGKVLKNCIINQANIVNTRSHDIDLSKYFNNFLELLLKNFEAKVAGQEFNLIEEVKKLVGVTSTETNNATKERMDLMDEAIQRISRYNDESIKYVMERLSKLEEEACADQQQPEVPSEPEPEPEDEGCSNDDKKPFHPLDLCCALSMTENVVVFTHRDGCPSLNTKALVCHDRSEGWNAEEAYWLVPAAGVWDIEFRTQLMYPGDSFGYVGVDLGYAVTPDLWRTRFTGPVAINTNHIAQVMAVSIRGIYLPKHTRIRPFVHLCSGQPKLSLCAKQTLFTVSCNKLTIEE